MSYQDSMALEDIAKVDDEMTRNAVKVAKKYVFKDAKSAVRFIGDCLKMSFEHMGIKNLNAGDFDKLQKANNIRIERRNRYQGIDLWRNGIYIYKDDVLAFFIGEPLKEVPHPLLRYKADHQFGFMVVTNAKVDRIGRWYTLPMIGG